MTYLWISKLCTLQSKITGNNNTATLLRNEHLTSLREFHQAMGRNEQAIKVGDVVLVHDYTP